ncbi:hypothetical protein X977_3284 [Burkholderia pseudomallei MSHR7504]|nr:hypothetical protein DO63_1669 [Burkholderia pseudomallei]KGS05886.1 hypothetical protein X977_3284 [Burkholderia pseudomallei MSHR7504]
MLSGRIVILGDVDLLPGCVKIMKMMRGKCQIDHPPILIGQPLPDIGLDWLAWLWGWLDLDSLYISRFRNPNPFCLSRQDGSLPFWWALSRSASVAG